MSVCELLRRYVVLVFMCKLMSMPDGITWVGQNEIREREREIKNFFDLNFKLCKNIIFARSFIRLCVCFFLSFSTHIFFCRDTRERDGCYVYVCLLICSTIALCQAKFIGKWFVACHINGKKALKIIKKTAILNKENNNTADQAQQKEHEAWKR